jgi:membrane-bound lytic murein transglycosylase D
MKTTLWLSIFLTGFVFFANAHQLKVTVSNDSLPVADIKKITVSNVTPASEELKNLLLVNTVDHATAGPRLNPQAVSFVKDYMEDHSKELTELKQWGLPYFNMMDGVFAKHGLPKELKYLAVIESRLKSSSISWAGAVGPWQFMPATALRMGLRVNRKVDDRTDYIKSTNAAAKYLKELYDIFGDWLLVIAAYNGGPGNVQKAIKKSKSNNFWKLQYYLPAESRTHVKKFIGTHYVLEGQGGLTTLTRSEVNNHYGAQGLYAHNRNISVAEEKNLKTQVIAGKYNAGIIAKYITMQTNEFDRLNPGFDKVMASTKGSYDLKLPVEKMDLFNANKYNILNESVQLLLNTALNDKENAGLTKDKRLAVK